MRNIFCLMVLVGIVACSGGSSGGGSKAALSGNTRGATSFAITNSTSGTAGKALLFGVLANDILSSTVTPTCSRLVKIVSNGTGTTIEAVFPSEECSIAASVTTSTHLIIKGIFDNVADIDGNPINCSYIALPLDSNSSTAQCLSKDSAGGIKTSYSQGWGKALIAFNDTVYFSTFNDSGTSINAWNGADTSAILFNATVGEFNEIYTSNGLNFFYFRLNPNIGLGGSYFYGNTATGFTMTSSYRDEPVILKNKLFTNQGGYDLDTGTALPQLNGCRTPNYGSDYQPIQLQWQSDKYAYWINRDAQTVGGPSLCRIDANETLEILENTYVYYKGWRSDNLVILVGINGTTPIATKIDLLTDTYQSNNLLSSFGLLEVTSIVGYLNGVVLHGTDIYGKITSVYYNTKSNSIEISPQDPTELIDIIPLKLQ